MMKSWLFVVGVAALAACSSAGNDDPPPACGDGVKEGSEPTGGKG